MNAPAKPVVLIAEELSPATIEALGPDFEIRHCDGADRAELLPAIADVDAILVRSATKVDAEALAAAPRLKVVARAGVGLDNVDVKAATQAGVMVVNAPTSNIVSAAELAVALMLAAARHISPAHAALRNGEWKRSKYTGIELYEKTVGIVGLGRIGVLVAQRLSAFGMKVIAYDPYVQAGRAAQMGVRLVDLDTLLAESDFMSVHLPKTPETVGLIGADQLAAAKQSLVLVNAARGGIVDEAALFDALKTGQIAAAGLDVFASEPCTDSPLFELDNVVATPHLGASTDEAQEKAGVPSPARCASRSAASSCPTRSTCRAASSPRTYVPASRSPRSSAASSPRSPARSPSSSTSRCAARSPSTTSRCSSWPRSRASSPTSSRSRSPTSTRRCSRPSAAPRCAWSPTSESPDHRNLITLRGTLADGTQVSVSGTLIGLAQKERLVEVNGFDVDIEPTTHLAFLTYEDRPGMVGTVGGILGDAAGQHRRHAGLAPGQGWRGAGRAERRLGDPGRDARRRSRSAMAAVSVRAVDLS